MLGTLMPRVPTQGDYSLFCPRGKANLALSCEECQETYPALVLGRSQPVNAISDARPVLDDLREPHHSHGVLQLHLAPVDLLQEVHHLIDSPELGIVVLDVPRREVPDPLDLDLINHRVEDLLPRRMLVADRDQDAVVLAVLVGFVAQTDRRRLAAAPQLVGENRRVEIEYAHRASLPIRRGPR